MEFKRPLTGDLEAAATRRRSDRFDKMLFLAHVSFTRLVLKDDQRRLFEQLSIYCDHYAELIPVSFVLGEFLNLKPEKKLTLQSHSSPPHPEALFSHTRFLCDPGGLPLVGPV